MSDKELTNEEQAHLKRMAALMANMTIIQINKARNFHIATGFLAGLAVATIIQLLMR